MVVIVAQVKEDHFSWYIRLLAAALALGMWFIILDMNRQRRRQLKFLFPAPGLIERAKKDIKYENLAITILIPLAVTFMLGLFSGTASQTMHILGFRHSNATVYVREVWSTVLARHGLAVNKAHLKPYTSRYDNITVALASFGSSVTLQFHAGGKTQTLRVPAVDVLIDPLPDRQAGG